ncbi:MAG: alginate O-acetyltransferase AlgX-related protein [Planctomycetota bacterium]
MSAGGEDGDRFRDGGPGDDIDPDVPPSADADEHAPAPDEGHDPSGSARLRARHRHPAEFHEDWQRELAETTVSPRLAKATVLLFAALCLAPVLAHLGADLAESRMPAVLHAWGSFAGVLAEVPDIDTEGHGQAAVERSLKDGDPLRDLLRPHAQAAITGWGGFGNHRAIVGRDNWLFYEPGLVFLTGRGLLDQTRLEQARGAMIAAGGDPELVRADPRPAILAFHQACAAAGVELLVVPIPDKAQLQPAQLTRRAAGGEWPRAVASNPDYAALIEDLQAAGVAIYDPTPRLIERDAIRFLRHDTHWTPAWQQTVAAAIAERVRELAPGLPAKREWTARPGEVARVGDLVDMLALPADQTLYRPQTVTIRRILDADGAPYRGVADAPVLLLGDSFSNIYQVAEMGWGEGAGLAAQLAYELETDVDAIARNGGGATAPRQALARRERPWAGKHVIVWAFAAREFMHGDWRVVPIHSDEAETAVGGDEALEGIDATVVLEMGSPPVDPSSTPYTNALIYLTARVVEQRGERLGDRVLLAAPLVRRRKLQAAAEWTAGERLRVVLSESLPESATTWEVVDQTEEYSLTPHWVVTAEEAE